MDLRIIVSLVLGLFLTGCAGLLDGPLTPSQSAGVGAVAAGTAAKIKQDLKDISTVKPVIHIKPVEVCFRTSVK